MKNAMKLSLGIFALTIMTAFGVKAQPMDNTVMVGGEAMYPKKNIVENAVNSKDHTTLVAAVKAAGLVDVLSGTGPFTVFAPTNDAFENLPAGTVDKLLKKENSAMLTSVLTYHVLSGNYTSDDLMKLIKKGNGTAKIATVQGDVLMFTANGNRNIMVTDQQGNKANISIYDVYQSNGVIFVIDQVLMPAK